MKDFSQESEKDSIEMSRDIRKGLNSVQNELKWEKVLYKNQPFPDNFTPASFLDDVVNSIE